MNKAELQFGPASSMSGFTALNTASFNDLQPARIVRELVQNSLDAAVDADEATAIIRFRVREAGNDDIPDLVGYKKALQKAIRDNKKRAGGALPDAAQQVVNIIQQALEELGRREHYLLSITDNGIGLNEDRMTALLGDGSSVKPTEAAGSYGIGHFATVPASDLRYVLYGGVLEDGSRIGAGFTILAGSHGRRHPISAQGYLVEKLLGGSSGALYDFLDRDTIPTVIDRALDDIQAEWRHGSVVMVPAFNYFGGYYDKWLRDIVGKVAAYNFSAAIHAGRLVLEVDEEMFHSGKKTRIDKGNLSELLEKERLRQRVYRSETVFAGLRPSGQNAWASYEVLSRGSRAHLVTPLGTTDISLITPAPTGNTRVDLFRNGMWITDDIPGLTRADFADWQPFHAVLQPRPGEEFHRLVRKAEGPMHNQLAFKLLSNIEQEQLETAIRAVATWIKDRVPKIQADEYTPDDFLLVSTGGSGAQGNQGEFSMWGSPVPVQRPRMSQRELTSSGRSIEIERDASGTSRHQRRRRNASRRTRATRSRPLPFRSTIVPQTLNIHNIELECSDAFNEVLLRLRIDENTDATCDRVWQEEEVTIRSFEALDVEGRELRGQIQDDGTTIRLSGLRAKTIYKLTVEHDVPPGLREAVRTPVVRVDLHRIPTSRERDTSDDDQS